jgi:hypothetical protein
MRYIKYLYALLWLWFGGALSWMAFTHSTGEYSNRRGQGLVMITQSLVDALGNIGAGLLIIAIAIAGAVWTLKGKKAKAKDEGDLGH